MPLLLENETWGYTKHPVLSVPEDTGGDLEHVSRLVVLGTVI